MVKQELMTEYEKLSTRQRLYQESIRYVNIFIGIGGLLFFLSIIPIAPAILQELLFRFFNILYDFYFLWGLCIIISFILIGIGSWINKRRVAPPELSPRESMFLKAIDAIKDIETYLNQEIEFSKIQAIKKLSQIERKLYEPSRTKSLWKDLTKNTEDELRDLKNNLKDRLIPVLKSGGEEEIQQLHPILEDFAKYLLHPDTSAIKELNNKLRKLPTAITREITIPLFEKYPRLRHVLYEICFAVAGYVAYRIGIDLIHISNEHAYYVGCLIWVTLTAAYMGGILKKL